MMHLFHSKLLFFVFIFSFVSDLLKHALLVKCVNRLVINDLCLLQYCVFLLNLCRMKKVSKMFCPSKKRQRLLLPANCKRFVAHSAINIQTIALVSTKFEDFIENDFKQQLTSLNSETKSSSCSSHPNILRRSEVCKDRDETTSNVSPVKSLSFSPSRFFNIIRNDEISGGEQENSKELLLSGSCSNSVEDSGIGASDIDTTLPLHSFSSTPRSKQHSRLSHWNNDKSPGREHTLNFNVNLVQSTPKSTNPDKNNTPTIQKFIDESVMDTPSPFKFSRSQFRKAENVLIKDLKLEEKLMFVEDDFFKRPSPIMFKRNKYETSGRKKSARKALVLDHFIHNNKSPQLSTKKKDGFLKVSCSQIKRLSFRKSSYDHSSLTEKTAVVEKRKITPVKSVYYTRKRKGETKMYLSNQWVSVACGKSSDQKDMIAAAKRCLYRN